MNNIYKKINRNKILVNISIFFDKFIANYFLLNLKGINNI